MHDELVVTVRDCTILFDLLLPYDTAVVSVDPDARALWTQGSDSLLLGKTCRSMSRVRNVDDPIRALIANTYANTSCPELVAKNPMTARRLCFWLHRSASYTLTPRCDTTEPCPFVLRTDIASAPRKTTLRTTRPANDAELVCYIKTPSSVLSDDGIYLQIHGKRRIGSLSH